MKRLYLTIILCFTFGLNHLYSQKIKDPKPEKVTIADFSVNGDRSVCLWYSSVFFFPYSYSNSNCGAFDHLFSLKNETFMRILLNRKDTCSNLFAISNFYNSIPELQTINYYYLNEKKVLSGPLKELETVSIINYFDKGCFFDLSSLKDTAKNIIVDLIYTYPISSKKKINFYIDNKLEYKHLYIRMDIPEIYKYNVNFPDSSLTVEISKPHPGPVIGYSFSGATAISSKAYWDRFVKNIFEDKNLNPQPIPAYCLVNSFIFRSKKSFAVESVSLEDNFPSIIKLDLNKIGIWQSQPYGYNIRW